MSDPKRLVVALEGVQVNNCVILPGALHVEEEEIDVYWNGDRSKVLGKARKMERNGNEVSMEIELNDDIFLDLEDKIGGYVYVQPFEAKDNPFIKGAISQVYNGRVRDVQLQDLGENDG